MPFPTLLREPRAKELWTKEPLLGTLPKTILPQ